MNTNKIISKAEVCKNTKPGEIGEGGSFYKKLFLLYFLNIVDWICTETLLLSGKFYEANPIMQGVLGSFWGTLIVKGLLPLVLVLICAAVFKFSDEEQSFISDVLLYAGITVYSLVNLLHIFNFILLFHGF